jgi:hypothetical protein
MIQNINEKINRINDPNRVKPNIVRITNKMDFEILNRIFNEGKTIYCCDSVIYGEQLISSERVKFEDFLIVRVHTSECMEGIFLCSFNMCGYGFFLESMELAESLEVYKATEDRDYYYTINKVTDKNEQCTITKKVVFNKKELLIFLTEYFEGIESFFVSGYVDSIEKGFYKFIK